MVHSPLVHYLIRPLGHVIFVPWSIEGQSNMIRLQRFRVNRFAGENEQGLMIFVPFPKIMCTIVQYFHCTNGV